MRAFTAQLRTELTLSTRQGEQLLVSIGIPLLILVFFSTVDVLPTGTSEPIDFLAPAVLALAVMSTAMVSLGIGTGFERIYGVLKRLGGIAAGPRSMGVGEDRHGAGHRGRPVDRVDRRRRWCWVGRRRAQVGAAPWSAACSAPRPSAASAC